MAEVPADPQQFFHKPRAACRRGHVVPPGGVQLSEEDDLPSRRVEADVTSRGRRQARRRGFATPHSPQGLEFTTQRQCTPTSLPASCSRWTRSTPRTCAPPVEATRPTAELGKTGPNLPHRLIRQRDARGSPFSSLLSKSVYLLSSPQRTRDVRFIARPRTEP